MASSIGKIVGRVLVQLGENEPIEVGTLELGNLVAKADPACDCTGQVHINLHVDEQDPVSTAKAISEKINASLNTHA